MGWIKNFFSKKPEKVVQEPHPRVIKAKYDAAQTTPDTRRHWANADALDAVHANSPGIRNILRKRARYEIANNPYGKGMILTLQNDIIGKGPVLQIQTDSEDFNDEVEGRFKEWMEQIKLAQKLRTKVGSKVTDGEAFGLMFSNLGVNRRVSLDLKLYEAEQIATPFLIPTLEPGKVDGIDFDEYDNPTLYHMLKAHPGGAKAGLNSFDDNLIPAEFMLHWFRADRPGQKRGVPEILSSLGLAAQMRDYTLAVIGSAKSVAEIAGVMQTTTPPGGEAAEVEPMNEMETERNTVVFAPEGWSMNQVKAEQPATTYPMFKKEIINEMGRPLNMPYNIAAANSSDYNYSSGRLDHQVYDKNIEVERGNCEIEVLDRLFAQWIREAHLAYGWTLDLETITHEWLWTDREPVDPDKAAKAQEKKLNNRTTTLKDEYAKKGKKWKPRLEQIAKEEEFMREKGITRQQAQAGANTESDNNDDEKENNNA